MILSDLPESAINELKTLAAEQILDITDPRVTGSMFYKAIQTEDVLSVSALNLLPETLLLVVKIAATSHTLNTVMFCAKLGENAPAIAAALATSNSIHTVGMSGNDLGIYGPATAANLATSNSIHTVGMSGNDLGIYGPATAVALVSSNTIHTVDMRANDLAENYPATKAVFDDHNAQIVDKAVLIKLLGHEMVLNQDVVDILGTYMTDIDFHL